jgi:hypothetical protein
MWEVLVLWREKLPERTSFTGEGNIGNTSRITASTAAPLVRYAYMEIVFICFSYTTRKLLINVYLWNYARYL